MLLVFSLRLFIGQIIARAIWNHQKKLSTYNDFTSFLIHFLKILGDGIRFRCYLFLVYVCLLARLLGAQFEIIKKSWVQRFHKFFIIFFNSRRRVPFPVLLLLPLVMNEVSENWRKTSHPTCNIDVCAQATKTIWPWISQTTLLSSLLKKASLLPTYIKKSVKSTQTRYGVKYFGRIMSFSDGKKFYQSHRILYTTHI